jgi:tetratricopeptide (TPR) repeat protein
MPETDNLATGRRQFDFGLRGWHATFIIVALTALAYLPAYFAGFIWDDPDYVLNNKLLRSWDGLRLIWLDPPASPQWYPLVFTSFWVEYQLWGLRPFGYHLNNVLLHIAGALVLWRVLRLLELPGAWLAAAIFAVHPVHVESVAWVTERKNVLSGVLYLSAGYCYLRFAGFGNDPKGWKRYGMYASALLLFVGALCSKSVTASLPAALLVVLWWKRRSLLPHVGWLAPMFALGALFGLHTAYLEKFHVGATGAEWEHTFAERCLIAGRAVWFYLISNLWPVNLMFIYPRWTISTGIWWQWLYPASVVAMLAGLVTACWRGWTGRGPLAAVLFFGGTLLPALGFFNVYPHRYSFVADHFQHLASIGIIALLAYAIARQPRWLGAGLLMILSVLTYRQATLYDSSLVLWRDNLNRNPTSFMVNLNYAFALNESAEQPGLTPDRRQAIRDEAFRYILKAREHAPHIAETHWNVGVGLAERGQFDEALQAFQQTLQIDPNYAPAYNSMGIIYTNLHRHADAVRVYRRAVELEPGFQRAQFNLARSLDRTGQLESALPHYAAAANMTPDEAGFRYRLGEALFRAGKYNDAIGHLAEATRLQPNFAEARYVAGEVLEKMGHAAEAAQQKQRAAQLLPGVSERVMQERKDLTVEQR